MKQLIACVSGLALLTLSACGDDNTSKGLSKEAAGALLKEVVIDAPVHVKLPTIGVGLPYGYAQLYAGEFHIILTLPLRGGQRMVGLNEAMIDKNGWKQYLDMNADDLVITNYYVSFLKVTGVIDPSTREGCTALAEYKVGITKETPWTGAYLKRYAKRHGSPKTDIYTACFVKYDDGWRVTQTFME